MILQQLLQAKEEQIADLKESLQDLQQLDELQQQLQARCEEVQQLRAQLAAAGEEAAGKLVRL